MSNYYRFEFLGSEKKKCDDMSIRKHRHEYFSLSLWYKGKKEPMFVVEVCSAYHVVTPHYDSLPKEFLQEKKKAIFKPLIFNKEEIKKETEEQ